MKAIAVAAILLVIAAVHEMEAKEQDFMSNYEGNDNYGRPKIDYVNNLSAMNDSDLEMETYNMIYHSARCANNPRADWHWMVDACYDQCKEREGDIYKKAYDECYRDHAQ